MAPDAAEPRVATLLAAAGWLRVSDDLLGGIGHDLNGRVSSLGGLLQILEMDGPEQTPVMSYLGDEARRLGDVVDVLRSLGGDVDGPLEPVMPADVVARAARLQQRHRGLETVQTETAVAAGVPPVRANPARLLRVLLVLLSRAGRAALDAGVRRLSLGARGDDGRVLFDVGWGPGAAAWETSGVVVQAHLLEQVLAEDGGTVSLPGRGSARVSLPAMTPTGAGGPGSPR
jgi:signal transduction histidine kinase